MSCTRTAAMLKVQHNINVQQHTAVLAAEYDSAVKHYSSCLLLGTIQQCCLLLNALLYGCHVHHPFQRVRENTIILYYAFKCSTLHPPATDAG